MTDGLPTTAGNASEAAPHGTIPAGGPPATREGSVYAEHAALNRAALTKALAEQQEHIARLAYRLLGWSAADLDDVVQEVFVVAIRGLPRFGGRATLATWLTTITLNVCRTQQRKRWLRQKREAPAPVESLRLIDGMGGPESMDADTFKRVRDAIQRLAARDREVIVLRYLEEMRVEDIAGVLNVAKNTVEVRLHRARERLREPLAELWKDTT